MLGKISAIYSHIGGVSILLVVLFPSTVGPADALYLLLKKTRELLLAYRLLSSLLLRGQSIRLGLFGRLYNIAENEIHI